MINISVTIMILWSPNDDQILGQIPSPFPSSQRISANGGKDNQKNEAFEPHTATVALWMSIPGKRSLEGTGDVLVFPQVVLCLKRDKHVILCPITLWPMLTDTQIYKESGRKEMLPGCSRCNNLSSASDMGTQVTIANGPPETDATKVQTGYQYVSMQLLKERFCQ